MSAAERPFSCTLFLKASRLASVGFQRHSVRPELIPMNVLPLEVPTKYDSVVPSSDKYGDCWTLNESSFGAGDADEVLGEAEEGVADVLLGDNDWDGEVCGCILVSMSIFSSFSSSRSFNSLTSLSNARTLSSNDSVYPRGNALRLSLSLVLHSKPTFEHCVQHGRMPSQRIFLLRHLVSKVSARSRV